MFTLDVMIIQTMWNDYRIRKYVEAFICAYFNHGCISIMNKNTCDIMNNGFLFISNTDAEFSSSKSAVGYTNPFSRHFILIWRNRSERRSLSRHNPDVFCVYTILNNVWIKTCSFLRRSFSGRIIVYDVVGFGEPFPLAHSHAKYANERDGWVSTRL